MAGKDGKHGKGDFEGGAGTVSLTQRAYAIELERLQTELLSMQEWIQYRGPRMVVVFEGRDTAGKGGSIKRITELLNPRYWLSVSDEEQERRFQQRIKNPHKRWKLSTIDLQARAHWVDYSEAKDNMFAYTDTKESPWWVVEADDKQTARLNLIAHLLSVVPYEPISFDDVKLPPRQERAYVRPPRDSQTLVPARYHVA